MKYYEMHELVYQDLEQKGFVSWDKHTDLASFASISMNIYLKRFLNSQNIELKGASVLDLGTGAGNCALFCASQGAKAAGVDVSSTAIKMAIKNAKEMGVAAKFHQKDILELFLNEQFNVVIDSSLLHCLTFPQDRSKFYSTAEKHLLPGGHLFIHTMTQNPDMGGLNDNFFHFDDEILWSLGMERVKSGRKEFKGKSYFPHRKILTEKKLIKEAQIHGFCLIEKQILSEVGHPDTFIGLFQLDK